MVWDALPIKHLFQRLKRPLSGVSKCHASRKWCLVWHCDHAENVYLTSRLFGNSYGVFDEPIRVFGRIGNQDSVVLSFQVSLRRHYRGVVLYHLLECVHAVYHKAYWDLENRYAPTQKLRHRQIQRTANNQKDVSDLDRWEYGGFEHV